MTTNAMLETHPAGAHHARAASAYLVPLGRLLFAAIFLMSAPRHFAGQTIEYARHAGVPAPDLLVPISGVLALVGGLSILLGYKARVGAWLLVIFLVPVTLMMHKFWGLADQNAAMVQRVMFMKNVSMLGAALMLTHFGAGPFSVDARRFEAHHH
ncbi:MAG TPA: DoxX family protein [Polyangiaceae bacterium]|nr:DoxX family protein [Polyangiaceae bacterium]